MIEPPEVCLNCKAVPPTEETAVIFVNVGFAFTLSPSKTVENPGLVLDIYAFVNDPFQDSVQSIASSSEFST